MTCAAMAIFSQQRPVQCRSPHTGSAKPASSSRATGATNGAHMARPVAMAGGKLYSFEEVRKHNDRKDCWLIIGGKVYDVTPFMEEHPGGDEVLLASTGKDATADFEDIGHTASAKEMMPQYCIGEVDVSTIPSRLTHAVSKDAASSEKAAASAGAWATLLQLAVPVLLLALAFALQSYSKAKAE